MRRTREFATSIPDDGLSGFVDLDEILLRRQRWGLGDPLRRAVPDGLIDIPFPDVPPKYAQSLPCSDRRGGSDPGGPRRGALGGRAI